MDVIVLLAIVVITMFIGFRAYLAWKEEYEPEQTELFEEIEDK